MKIAFTICSNNYLAQAKILLQSLSNTNADYVLILGLVDKKLESIDYTIKNTNIIIVEISLLNIPEEYNIFQKYNIIELSTAVKASYIKWIKKTYPKVEQIYYFDPDIKIFSSFKEIEVELKNKSIVLTPHIYKPIPMDNFIPDETLFLNYGIYNLGFIGISFEQLRVYDFLNWWEERLMKQCFINVENGIFVDQLPINYVTVFYPEITKILFHDGMNVAPWNLQERQISIKGKEYYANDKKLLFFHFSNICFEKGKHPIYNRYELYPMLEELYDAYRDELKKNYFFELRKLPCWYKVKPIKKPVRQRILGIMPQKFREYIKSLVSRKNGFNKY